MKAKFRKTVFGESAQIFDQFDILTDKNPKLVLQILFLWMICWAAHPLQAQRATANRADRLFAKGEIAAAKTEIDNALAYEIALAEVKNINPPLAKAKTYFVKGKIYQEIAINRQYAHLSDRSVQEAIDAYKTIQQQEKENSIYAVFSRQQCEQFYAELFNRGVSAFGQDDFIEALDQFEKAALVFPQDTTAWLNALRAAYALKDQPKSEQIIDHLRSMNYHRPFLYVILAREKIRLEHFEAATKIIEEGKTQNPDNQKDLLILETSLHLKNKNYDQAVAAMQKAVAAMPDDASLNVNLGALYHQLAETMSKEENNSKKADEYLYNAIFQYKKALALLPNDPIALYGLGSIYYNNAAQTAKQLNSLQMDNKGRYKDATRSQLLQNQIHDFQTQAAIYFEELLRLKPNERSTLETLARIYAVLGKQNQADKINQTLKELGNQEEN